jgi:hypothetical protein
MSCFAYHSRLPDTHASLTTSFPTLAMRPIPNPSSSKTRIGSSAKLRRRQGKQHKKQIDIPKLTASLIVMAKQ